MKTNPCYISLSKSIKKIKVYHLIVPNGPHKFWEEIMIWVL